MQLRHHKYHLINIEKMKNSPILLIIIMLSSITALSQEAIEINVAKKKIQMQIEAYVDALGKSDSIALGNLYTIDARILNHGSPSTIGRPEIIKVYGEMIRDGITGSSFNMTGLWGNNNLIVEEGIGYFSLSNGKVVSKGRYLIVWKKEKGQWKIFRDTFFSDGKLPK